MIVESPQHARERRRALTTPSLIAIDDLPIARTEIELSAPTAEIALASDASEPAKILALVRLHTHPMGVVILDGGLGRSWDAHAPAVWATLGSTIDAHLASDRADPVDEVIPVCVRHRRNVLAGARPITVIVATRDRPASLRRCLESLLRMDYPCFDILVVDNDPPTDETADLIAECFAQQVRYVRENRRGLASAHNCGLEAADGEIVAFVDDDVLVDRHWLTGIAEGFATTPDVGCVTGLILPEQLSTPAQLLLERHGGFDKGFDARVFDMGRHRPEDPLFPFTAGKFGSGANMAFDTGILRRLGGFDAATGVGTYARGGDDLAAFFRVVVAGHALVYQPSAVVWHRHHQDTAALRNQAYGYGVGLGAFLTSAVVHEPKMLAALLRRAPKGVAYAFASSSHRNRGRYDGWPRELARLEKRGLLSGPAAYAVSRWRTRRAVARA